MERFARWHRLAAAPAGSSARFSRARHVRQDRRARTARRPSSRLRLPRTDPPPKRWRRSPTPNLESSATTPTGGGTTASDNDWKEIGIDVPLPETRADCSEEIWQRQTAQQEQYQGAAARRSSRARSLEGKKVVDISKPISPAMSRLFASHSGMLTTASTPTGATGSSQPSTMRTATLPNSPTSPGPQPVASGERSTSTRTPPAAR